MQVLKIINSKYERTLRVTTKPNVGTTCWTVGIWETTSTERSPQINSSNSNTDTQRQVSPPNPSN